MSPAFEAFLARLYVDAEFRTRFLENRESIASSCGLNDAEIAALRDIQEDNLQLASRSFEKKRSKLLQSRNGSRDHWKERLYLMARSIFQRR